MACANRKDFSKKNILELLNIKIWLNGNMAITSLKKFPFMYLFVILYIFLSGLPISSNG